MVVVRYLRSRSCCKNTNNASHVVSHPDAVEVSAKITVDVHLAGVKQLMSREDDEGRTCSVVGRCSHVTWLSSTCWLRLQPCHVVPCHTQHCHMLRKHTALLLRELFIITCITQAHFYCHLSHISHPSLQHTCHHSHQSHAALLPACYNS